MNNFHNDGELQAVASRYDVQNRDEASILLWFIWRETRVGYSKLQDCINALAEDDDLYQALKTAHARGEYDRIRQWRSMASFCIRCRFVDSLAQTELSPKYFAGDDDAVHNNVQEFLRRLEPTMKKLVVGDIVLPLWTPSNMLNPGTIAHLTSLRIPSLKGKPNLLLHDLGCFTRDVLLEKRLKNIFMPNNHT